MSKEKVNHPSHYLKDSGHEVIDVIESWDLNFSLGNAIKYICRAGHKGGQLKRCEDLEKAIDYLQNELHHEENFLIQSGEGIPFKIQPEEFSYKEATYISEESDRRGI